MTTPESLLAACRADPAVRGILADAIRDDDGDTPAVLSLLNDGWQMKCERCNCPDTADLVCWDVNGTWHLFDRALDYDPEMWLVCFGGIDDPDREPGTLSLYRALGRWHLVCPHCKRSLVARKAAATKKANAKAHLDAVPNLFTGVGD